MVPNTNEQLKRALKLDVTNNVVLSNKHKLFIYTTATWCVFMRYTTPLSLCELYKEVGM